MLVPQGVVAAMRDGAPARQRALVSHGTRCRTSPL
jgi:hypothetical protein